MTSSNSCLVQPAREIYAGFLNELLAAVRVKRDKLYEKLELFSPVRGAPS